MKMKNVQDIYPLTPLQQGMLFHSLSTPGASMYCDQLSWIIDDKIDMTAMRTAWQRVVNRHPILRASFLWEDLDEPLQVIRSEVRLPWNEFDWQSLNPQEQKKKLERFLKEDLQKGFQLSKAPLMRISLIRLGEKKFRIVWSLHHLLLDGWSLSLVLNEVFRIYESLRHGDEIEPEQTASFRDYIAWLQKQDFNEARDFWKQALKGHNGLSLLFKGNNGTFTSGDNPEYAECRVILSPADTGMLEKYARTHQFTLNSLVQGAWAILLSRYSGEQRVIFGATVSGRPADLPGAESMIGLFINTLPVAVTIDYGQTLSANIRQIQDKQVEARQFEHTPLMQIKKWSNIPKSLPLFDSILVFENYPVDLNRICSNCKFDSESVFYSGHTHFPLHLRVYPGEELSVTLVYDTVLVDKAIAEQMLNYLREILINIPAIIETNLYQFVRRIEEAGNASFLKYSSPHPANSFSKFEKSDIEQSIVHRFEKQVRRYPDNIAIRSGKYNWSYNELDRQANRIASIIIEKTGTEKDRVALLFHHDAPMVAGIFGALKAGKTYVPLDPFYPPERLERILTDARVQAIITNDACLNLAKKMAAGVLPVINIDKIRLNQLPENISQSISPDTIAYILYTSGSTGQPKGVIQNHRNVLFHIMNYTNNLHISENDRLTLLPSYSFDAAVMDIFGALLNGATLCLFNLKTSDMLTLPDWLQREKITIYHSTPTLYRFLMSSIEPGKTFDSIRLVVLGGEEAFRNDFDQFKLHFSENCVFVNGFGPTECTIALQNFLTRDTHFLGNKLPIGFPVTGIDIELDNSKNGGDYFQGEILIKSEHIALGYWNDKAGTEKAFSGMSSPAYPGVYRSGDIGRKLPDGSFEYIGRKDQQVKIRGYRIELSEIETALLNNRAIKNCVVIDRDDLLPHKCMVAYIVAKEGYHLQKIELRNYLVEKLPQYMVPSFFVYLNSLPLSPTGKTDRNSLPLPDISEIHPSEEKVSPRNEIETILVRIWKETLKLKNVGIYENFFELGGDSILSLQISFKANQAGLKIAPNHLFKYQTIAELARMLDKSLLPGKQKQQASADSPLPLLPAQQWLIDAYGPIITSLSHTFLFQSGISLEPEIVRNTITFLCNKHQSLQMRFLSGEDGYQQKLANTDVKTAFEFHNLSDLTTHEQPEQIKEIICQAQSTLNLQNGPLFKIILLQSGSDKADQLVFIFHLLSADGFSWKILLEDFQSIYNQIKKNVNVLLQDTNGAIRRLGEGLEEFARSINIEEEISYLVKLTQLPSTGISVNSKNGRNTFASMVNISLNLNNRETTALLNEAPAAYGTRTIDLLIGALSRALFQWQRIDTITIMVENHDRDIINNISETSHIIGNLSIIFPLNLSEIDNEDPANTIKQVKEVLRNSPNNTAGLGVHTCYNQNREVRKRMKNIINLSQVKFSFMNGPDVNHSPANFLHFQKKLPFIQTSIAGENPFLLEIECFITGGQLQITWRYSQNLFSDQSIIKFANHYIRELKLLIRHCLSPGVGGYTPSDFPGAKLSQNELDTILANLQHKTEK